MPIARWGSPPARPRTERADRPGTARHERRRRPGGPLGRVDRAVHRLLVVRVGGLLQRRLQREQLHELLATVDRAQLHQLRGLPARPERATQHPPRIAHGKRLQLGAVVPHPDEQDPAVGAVAGGTPRSRPRGTSPTSRRSSRPARSSSRRTTGAATSGGGASRSPEVGGRPASSTSRTRVPTVATTSRAWQVAGPSRVMDTKAGLGAPLARHRGGQGGDLPGRRTRAGCPRQVSRRCCSTSTPPRPPRPATSPCTPRAPRSRGRALPPRGRPAQRPRPCSVGSARTAGCASTPSATTDLSVDVVGWSATGGHLSGGAPVRVLDTRTGLGARRPSSLRAAR